ncbi:mitochondrial import inner membrane translocase subunit TIM44-1-like [Camellia sinensis]|uniref:mitochondrial import inner membrane translocase subunit TIM44-1-like n=1 Tax=Camellia sinensis TaxID=4442 RepID=UPI001036053D|nr:mitochondrial import inner membrane translocase subunit TIM44-1-like [Camellia sinensis]
MASRKLVRDLFLPNRSFCIQILTSQQVPSSGIGLKFLPANGYWGNRRQFNVFNLFFKKDEGGANRYKELLRSVKELEVKVDKLKGLTDALDYQNLDFQQSIIEQLKEKAVETEPIIELLVDMKERTKQILEQLDKLKAEDAEAMAKKV